MISAVHMVTPYSLVYTNVLENNAAFEMSVSSCKTARCHYPLYNIRNRRCAVFENNFKFWY
jgi:hypothetical protein